MRRAGLAVVVSVLGVTSVARAQPAPPEPDDAAPPAAAPGDAAQKNPVLAKKLVAAGDKSARRGDALARGHKDATTEWEQARRAYDKAIEIGDDPNILLALALTEQKLGKLADAIRHFRALATTPGVRPEVAKLGATKAEDVLTKVALVTLAIVPDNAIVSVDGGEVGKAPLAEPIVLLPGSHTIAIAAAGFQSKQVEVKAEAGTESDRRFKLEEAPTAVAVAPPTTGADGGEPEAHPRVWPMLAGAGGVVALAGVATVTGILAVKDHNRFVLPSTSRDAREQDQSRGRTFAHVTDGLFGGAIVVGAATAAYYWWVYRPAARHEHSGDDRVKLEASKLEVAPWVQVGTGGVVVGGQF